MSLPCYEVQEQMKILKERNWTEKHGYWSHPKRTYVHFEIDGEGPRIISQPYLFTFEQVLKIEGLE